MPKTSRSAAARILHGQGQLWTEDILTDGKQTPETQTDLRVLDLIQAPGTTSAPMPVRHSPGQDKQPVRSSHRTNRNLSVDVPKEGSLRKPVSAADDVRFLRLGEVKLLTGLGKTTIYALIKTDDFPASVRVGNRAVGWIRSEVKQWAERRVMSSRSAA